MKGGFSGWYILYVAAFATLAVHFGMRIAQPSPPVAVIEKPVQSK